MFFNNVRKTYQEPNQLW